MNGILPLVGSLGLSCQNKKSVSYLVCSSRPVHKIFLSSPYTISLHISPVAQLAGQAVVPVRLSLSTCHCNTPSYAGGRDN
jgi:hypothetical protein